MSEYTTGELAAQCGITVRAVQYYDRQGLLAPSALSEGGRRLYSKADLAKLRLICMLKSLGLSLSSIKAILHSPEPEKVLGLLLEEQLRWVEGELEEKRRQREAIRLVREDLARGNAITLQSTRDIERMMKEKKQLRGLHITMLAVGILMDLIEVGALLLLIYQGIWLPFAIGMPLVILMVLTARMYYQNTAYICPKCHERFRPRLSAMLFAPHTPRARRLTCPHCGQKGYCVECYAKKGTQ